MQKTPVFTEDLVTRHGAFMLLSGHQIKRAGEARQRFTGSDQKKGMSFQMADISNTSLDFLSQVSALAPTKVAELISSTARITLELLIEQCLTCFETQFSQPTLDCRWHRFEKRFMQVADAEAPTLEKALRKLESAMAIRERQAA